jgi:predicted metal-dependent phosphoesterase TrpH
MRAGYVASVREAMQRYIGNGKPAYVPRYELLPETAVAMIREAGGVAVLAHPGLIRDESVLRQALTSGVEGLEVYYPQHDAGQENRFLREAQAFQGKVTGGSDFHGLTKGEQPDWIGIKGLDEEKFASFVHGLRGIYAGV